MFSKSLRYTVAYFNSMAHFTVADPGFEVRGGGAHFFMN